MKKKKVFCLRVRLSDDQEWSEPSYFKTKGKRDKIGAMNRIIAGFRTHSFEERKSEEELAEIEFE